MSTYEDIANKVVGILQETTLLYTDGNTLSTDTTEFVAQSYTTANARDILALANDIDISFNEDTILETADVWVEIDGQEVCIDTFNNKVHVGFYNTAQVSYYTNDDVIGIYDELINGDYA